MIEPKVFSVGQINRYIKNLLENDFILNSLLVQGERMHRGRLPA